MPINLTKPLNLKYNRPNALTSKEKAFIFANYKTMTGKDMALRLGRSEHAIQWFMHKYNLPLLGKTNRKPRN